jgi:drug/metabolite transporter (DMT)-like permease
VTSRVLPRQERLVLGIAYIVAATLMFITMNTSAKWLSAHLHPVELIWARSLGQLLFVFCLFAPNHGGWRLFVTRRPLVQAGRSVVQLASTSMFITAIGKVALADATSISFLAPLLVAALSGPVLGERVSQLQWVAIAAGFGGALLIIRPTGETANLWALLILGSAVCYAGYQILTRGVAGIDSPQTSVVYSALAGAVVLSVIVPFFWTTPRGWLQWVVFLGLGLVGGLGHYFVARAFSFGRAAVISPFHYVQLIWASVVGYVVFGHVPTAWTWLGAAIIIAGGLFIALLDAATPRYVDPAPAKPDRRPRT